MLQGLSVIVAIVSVCCYFYVIYQMFDKAESVIAIVCLVGICLFGLGGIVAFVYGWIKAREWEIVPVMAVWSRDESGKIVPLDVKAGDRILFGKWSGTEIKLNGEDLLIMKEADVMGVIA
jgi:chaperonin GroES